mmetsp:Transcript_20846/g.21162  ORF Transcript_20846/g.21162 Transcript_20846/m.21162 type:complete len:102 (-) Transcript_20846:49-354(-)
MAGFEFWSYWPSVFGECDFGRVGGDVTRGVELEVLSTEIPQKAVPWCFLEENPLGQTSAISLVEGVVWKREYLAPSPLDVQKVYGAQECSADQHVDIVLTN